MGTGMYTLSSAFTHSHRLRITRLRKANEGSRGGLQSEIFSDRLEYLNNLEYADDIATHLAAISRDWCAKKDRQQSQECLFLSKTCFTVIGQQHTYQKYG